MRRVMEEAQRIADEKGISLDEAWWHVPLFDYVTHVAPGTPEVQ